MRSSTLDILRAVAVLLVYCQHSVELPVVSAMGWVGVDLFFVLSGFLVSGLLFREYQQTQHVRSGRFLLRRGFKIYPQFYLLLAFTVPFAHWDGKPLPGREITAEALFVQNYFQDSGLTPGLSRSRSISTFLLAIAIAVLARQEEQPISMLAEMDPGRFRRGTASPRSHLVAPSKRSESK